jgi:succinate dehydrogenase/fumarate reductase flavoprotein subunit
MIEEEYDLIVVGAGAAGLAAAATAAIQNQRVLLLEHTAKIGGTTAVSGGMVWIPANHKMAQAGLEDSEKSARRYLEQAVPGSARDPRMQAYLAHGDEAIRFLESYTSLRLRPVQRYPDYYPDMNGATAGGRVLEPVAFDGRELGADFKLLRDPLPEFTLLGGMMISREDIPKLRRFSRSPAAAWHVLKLVTRYVRQRLSAHRGTTLVLGNALAARLFKSARDLGVHIALNVQVDRLLAEQGRISGVAVRAEGRERTIRSRLGVVLATGGLSNDDELRARYVPVEAGRVSATVNARAPHGGARLGLEAGAALSAPVHGLDDALAFWVPASTWRRPDGTQGLFPHTVTDRAKPGLIAVNRLGRRFVNEAVSYHEFVRAQLKHADSAIPAWLICDSRFLWKYGLGRIRPFALSTQTDVASGYLRKAPSLEELSRLIGVPAASLTNTIERFNASARNGEDPEFGRGCDIYQRHLGDADQKPNPCVAPLEKSPFYAVPVIPADLGMAAGLQTDEHARVLRPDGSPIEGLYACGNDMHSIMNGAYPGPGITLGPALVFGVIAARHALGQPLQ